MPIWPWTNRCRADKVGRTTSAAATTDNDAPITSTYLADYNENMMATVGPAGPHPVDFSDATLREHDGVRCALRRVPTHAGGVGTRLGAEHLFRRLVDIYNIANN